MQYRAEALRELAAQCREVAGSGTLEQEAITELLRMANEYEAAAEIELQFGERGASEDQIRG